MTNWIVPVLFIIALIIAVMLAEKDIRHAKKYHSDYTLH